MTTNCNQRSCLHTSAGPHCREMMCSNYSEKCPAHRIVQPSDVERITQLIGELISEWIDHVPDDQVIASTKNEIHDMLEEGAMFDQPEGRQEPRLLELITLLGFTRTSSVWTIEAALIPLIDSYDLFND